MVAFFTSLSVCYWPIADMHVFIDWCASGLQLMATAGFAKILPNVTAIALDGRATSLVRRSAFVAEVHSATGDLIAEGSVNSIIGSLR